MADETDRHLYLVEYDLRGLSPAQVASVHRALGEAVRRHLRRGSQITSIRTQRKARRATPPASPQDPAARRRWLALAVLAVAQFMVFLNETVVNIALPSIKTSLRFSEPSLAWVINAYVLVFGGLILLGGRAADLAGRRRIFLTGTARARLAM